MTTVRSGSKHEADRSPRRKGHGRVDDFAKTHLRGLETLFKAKREMLKKKTRKLVHRRHKHGDQGVNDIPHKQMQTNMSTSKDGTTAEHGGASASKASRPAANGKQFYQHLDNNCPLHNHYEDDIASALRDTSLGCTNDGAPINGNRKLASKLVDYDYDEQACLADALEASAREKQDHDEEVRAFEMVLRHSVEDQGGVRYHTYEPPSRMGESSNQRGGSAMAVYNPDHDGESSVMGSLRGSIRRRGDDPPPVYTPY